MSLEAAIEKNTEALNRLIETLAATEANRSQVLAKTEEAIAQANAPKPRAKKTEAAETPATTTATPPPPPPATVVAPSAEEVLKHFGTYVGVEDENLRTERKTIVRKILEQVGAPKVSEIAEGKRAQAIELLQQQIASEKSAAAAAAEDDLM